MIVHLPPRPAAPAKPADRPAVAQPAPPRRRPPGRSASPRLDLGEPPRRRSPRRRPSRSRFGRGLLLALVLAVLALAAYLYREPIAARVPQAAPALGAYGETIDRWRAEIEERLGQFRPNEPGSPGYSGQPSMRIRTFSGS